MFRILILLVLGVGVGYMLRGRSFVGVTKWSIQITVCEWSNPGEKTGQKDKPKNNSKKV